MSRKKLQRLQKPMQNLIQIKKGKKPRKLGKNDWGDNDPSASSLLRGFAAERREAKRKAVFGAKRENNLLVKEGIRPAKEDMASIRVVREKLVWEQH